MNSRSKRKRLAPLLKERAETAERTQRKLDEALDRFQHHKLINIKKGSKLTLRNLALEAGVSKDTPLSRYRKGHPQAGEYRFPLIVARFRKMNAAPTAPPPRDRHDKKIRELREQIKTKDMLLISQARTINEQDKELYDTRIRNRELETQNAVLRRESMKVVPLKRGKGGRG